MGEPIWTPDGRRIAASNLTRFADFVRERYDAPPGGYDSLWRWSVEERERFWTAVMEFSGVLHTPGTAPVLRHRDRMPGAVWFEDTRLNFAENLLARDDDHPALIFANERGARRTLTYRQLRAEVGRVAAGLRELGIGPGTQMRHPAFRAAPAGYLPDMRYNPERLVAERDQEVSREDDLKTALARLDTRSRDIIQRRWLNEEKPTLHELAAEYGVSAERIRQIEKKALDSMKNLLTA